MNLQEHYDRLWLETLIQFKQNDFEYDTQIDSPLDNRFGITILIRPDRAVVAGIQEMLQELRHLEPAQYYYPPDDIHVTVLSVISCYPGFTLAAIQPEAYIRLVDSITSALAAFRIRFSGITASPASVMVQGFPVNNTLQEFRDQLRQHFKSSDLQQSIDTRYIIQTAHCTVARFKTALAQPAAFVDVLEKYRSIEFGTSTIKQAELVFNDWYQRKKFVQQLAVFDLQ